jgi:hypothetical protein
MVMNGDTSFNTCLEICEYDSQQQRRLISSADRHNRPMASSSASEIHILIIRDISSRSRKGSRIDAHAIPNNSLTMLWQFLARSVFIPHVASRLEKAIGCAKREVLNHRSSRTDSCRHTAGPQYKSGLDFRSWNTASRRSNSALPQWRLRTDQGICDFHWSDACMWWSMAGHWHHRRESDHARRIAQRNIALGTNDGIA